MKRIFLTFLFSIVLTSFNVICQTLDTKGNDFWLTFMPNYHNYKYHSNQLFRYSDSVYIFISASEPTTGTIEYYDINGNPYSKNFSITDPRELYVFKLPFNDFELVGFNDMGQSWNQNMCEIPVKSSFHITTDKNVNVYAHSQGNKSSDAFLVIPTPSLGKEYIVLAYKSDGNFTSTNGRTPSEFAIVAIEDNTNIDIIPSVPTYVNEDLRQNVTLNKGEVYLLQAKITRENPLADLTGTIINANKPIAVFAGHQRATLPVEDFSGPASASRDFLCEQLPPIQVWGRSAFIVPFPQP
ncbi:MAG: IgGFc-binding protein, partial [Candidatus Kapaibacteriota bacterium]